jgi:hypothetical protein
MKRFILCCCRRDLVFLIVLVLAASLSGCEGFFVDPQLVSVSVSPPSPSLVKGNTQQFTAVGTYDDGHTKVLGNATWTTSNASVVFLNSSGMGTATGIGSVTVSASSGVAAGSTTATVLESPVTALQVTPMNPTISIGSQNTQQFSAIAVFGDGTTRDISSSVTWTSSDSTVATISNTGLATASAKKGTATMTATSGAVSSSTLLTVLP